MLSEALVQNVEMYISCGRKRWCRMWKCTSPVGVIHNTMSERSLSLYILTSVVKCMILHDTGLLTHCGYAEVADREKSFRGMYSFLRMVDFQLD